jgi:cystinosin
MLSFTLPDSSSSVSSSSADSASTVVWLSFVSACLGWLYFICWSFSFYPQFILNYRLKRVTGLSLEYQAYNFTGFAFYSIYTVVNYIEQRRLGLPPSVALNDVAFAVHAFIVTCLTSIQVYQYREKGRSLDRPQFYLLFTLWAFAIYNFFLAAIGALPLYCSTCSGYTFSALEFLGDVKVFISFVKYIPQALLNASRQSTLGWSIDNILLDLSGGILSFSQQFLDVYRFSGDFTIIYHNIPKFLLSVETIAFDLLFIVQHYILYPNSQQQKENGDEEQRAVEEGEYQPILEQDTGSGGPNHNYGGV